MLTFRLFTLFFFLTINEIKSQVMLKYAKKYDLSLKRKHALRIAVVAKVYADSHTLFLQTIFLLNHKS